MKNIFILAAVLLTALYYIITEIVWQFRNRLFRRRIIIGVLIAALLVSQLDIMSLFMKTDAETSYAAEAESSEIITVSAFAGLPDDIIKQTVPIGTALDELELPDTLEAVCVKTDSNLELGTDENPEDSSENADNTEDVTPGEETDTEDETPENDPEDDPQAEEDDAEAENENADEEEEDVNLIEEQSPEGNDTEVSEEKQEETIKTETGSSVMPEYYSEHIVEVKTLEADSPEGEADSNTSEVSRETIIIENITWQSGPEYDGDTEGEYIFTAVLPEEYVLTDGVNMPQIKVTVGETDNIALLSGEGIMTIAATHSHSGWTATSSLPSSSGSYYLTSNVNVSSGWTTPSGTVNLCLNGKTISGTITVPSGATLNIYDEGSGKVSTNSNVIIVQSGGKAYIYGGTYETSASGSYAISVNDGGFIQIDGGTINKGTPAGATATISIRGEGIINNATVSGYSNAVLTESGGKAYIYGGTFSSDHANTLAPGTGSYMYINMINGGTVYGNVSDRYAINVSGTADIVYAITSGSSTAVNVNSGASAEINGGSFNSTSNDTITNSGTLTITGGTFTGGKYAVNNSGTFKLSGSPTFSGSTADIYLPSGKKITITGTLSNTTPYSVSTATTPTLGSPVVITDSSATSYNDNKKFASKNSSYVVHKNSSSQLELAIPATYTITYAAGSYGSGSVTSGIKTEGIDFTLSDRTFTRVGYTQTGWSKNADGTIKDFELGGKYTDDAAITLYPYWEVVADAHSNHNDITWTSITSLPSSAGNYYLTGDVSLSGTWTAPSGTTNFCLNGHNITFSSGYISVPSGSTLNIFDCQDKGTITGTTYGISISDGNVTVNGGTINAKSDSGIRISGTGTLTVHGGTITSTSAARHGILTETSSNAFITMDGGTVTTEKAAMTAIYLEGKDIVSISGGTICNDNTTSASGAFYIGGSCQVTISGGIIRGTLYGIRNLGTTSITNATVIGGNYGLRNEGTVTIDGGSFSGEETYAIQNEGSINLSGSPTITGSTADIYLPNGKKITVAGTLGNTTPYSVLTSTKPTSGSPVVFTTGTTTYNDKTKFTSANSSYIVRINSSSQLELAVLATYTITYNAGDYSSGESRSYTKTEGTNLTLLGETFTRTGYKQTGWSKNSSGTTKDYNLGATYTPDASITLYPYWTADTYTVKYEKNGGTIADENKYISYTYGLGLTLPKPTRTGYTFGGWFTDSDFSGAEVKSISATDTGAKTYYAKWVNDTAPEITLSYSYEPIVFMDWLIGNKSLVITVHVTEAGSGVDEIKYTVTESGKGQGEEKIASLVNGEAKITVNKDFKGTIKITCTDRDGNPSDEVTVGTDIVRKDNVNGIIIEDHAPQISFANGNEAISSSEYFEPSELNLAVSITDEVNGSDSAVISGGIASVTYQVGSKAEKSVDNNFKTAMVTVCNFTIPASELSTGANKITVTVKDNAGNTAKSELTVGLKGQEKKPNPQTADVSAEGKSDGKITDLEPNETYEISKDGGKTWETKTADNNGEITGLPAGDYKIRTKAKDVADGGTFCSDAADCKIGTKSPSESNGGSSGSEGQNGNSGGQTNGDGDSSQAGNTSTGTVTSPTDTSKTETPKKETSKKETSKTEEATQDTDAKTEESEEPEQSTNPDTKPSADTADQTAPTETENGEVNITGDSIATGTITGAQNTTTTLTVGEGSVSVTVVSDEYQYAAGVADTVAVANAVLTQEQIRLVNNGEKIEIRVDVKDISEQVSKEDKDIIENRLTAENREEELTLGAYIDISMFIKIGDGDWNAITQSGEEIEVVIEIPNELQTGGRTFYIARCHEGQYALLEDMDTDAETITIRTALFSTYAIVYRQTDAAGSKCGLCHICPTFLGICCFIWLAIIAAAAIVVMLIVSIRRRERKLSLK